MNLKNIKNNPQLKKVLKDLKPKKSIWGFLSVVLLFIVPEIISFVYGDDIKRFCHQQLLTNPPYHESYMYENIADFFGEGSYINLSIGILFLIWLFF